MGISRPLFPRALRGAALVTTAASVAALSLLAAGPASAATLDVCPSGCTFTTIQSAVNAATAGDTIDIGAGTYTESVTIDRSLTLRGPNSTISPNTSNPLVGNGARVPEAILMPPVGDNINSINITAAAAAVTITGLTFDQTGTTYVSYGQKYVRAIGPANGSLTLVRNIFNGGHNPGMLTGSLTYDVGGNGHFTATDNRTFDTGPSNGWYVHNDTASGTIALDITHNVWLDNGYTVGNFGASSGATVSGTISDNWIGNSTAGVGGVDGFPDRQSGLLFAGVSDGLVVTHNTFADIEDVGIYFYNGFSGTASITENTFTGFNNVSSRALVLTGAGGLPTDVSGVVFTQNSITGGTTGSQAVRNPSGVGVLDARGNWWGTPTPVFVGLVNVSDIEDAALFTVLVDGWLTADPNAAPPAPAPAPAPSLAATGADDTTGVTLLALLLVMLGAAALFGARRLTARS